MILAIILSSAAISILIHLAGMALAANLLGAPPTKVKLFFGPTLFERQLGSSVLDVGPLPFGGYLDFRTDDGPNRLASLHPLQQAAVAISGCALLVAAAVVAGAPLSSFVRSFAQIPLGALQPFEIGAPLVRALIDLFARSETMGAAVLGMKIAAFNLLPFPTLNGFQVLAALVFAARGKRSGMAEPPPALHVAGIVLALGLAGGWIAAIARALMLDSPG